MGNTYNALRKRLTKFVIRSYNKQNHFWLLCTIVFVALLGLTAVTKIANSSVVTAVIWLPAFIITLLSLSTLWNPFRAGVLLSLFGVTYCIETQNVWLAVLPLIVGGISMYGWYQIIQKPNDRRLARRVHSMEQYLES